MSIEKNLALARRWFDELWSQGNLDVADEIVAPNYAPDWIHIPQKGPDQVKHEVRYFRTIFPDLQYEIEDSATLESKVWIRYKGIGTHKGNAWGFEPTNKQVAFEGATLFTLNAQGKITDRWGAFCFYDILADLELVPPIWELNQHLKGFRS